MDIENIKRVQQRIREIQSQFKTIQRLYRFDQIEKKDGAAAIQNQTDSKNVTNKTNIQDTSNTYKIAEELLKAIITNKRTINGINNNDVSKLIQSAIDNYSAVTKNFTIEE